jgi:hypothetical protein
MAGTRLSEDVKSLEVRLEQLQLELEEKRK